MNGKFPIFPLLVGLLFLGLVNTLTSVDEPDRTRSKMALSVNPDGVATFVNDAIFAQVNEAANTNLVATKTGTKWTLKIIGWLLVVWGIIVLGYRVISVRI